MSEQTQLKFALVYQGGIANVFQVDDFRLSGKGRNARRIAQSSFMACEAFCAGALAAGAVVLVASCNEAGDITDRAWSNQLEDCPFLDEARPVFTKGVHWMW